MKSHQSDFAFKFPRIIKITKTHNSDCRIAKSNRRKWKLFKLKANKTTIQKKESVNTLQTILMRNEIDLETLMLFDENVNNNKST